MALMESIADKSAPSQDDWMDSAKCRSLDPTEAERTFFVGRGQNKTKAESICNSCLVQKKCLQYAIVNNELGIWAGTSEKDRREMRAFVTSIEYLFLRRTIDVDELLSGSVSVSEDPLAEPEEEYIAPVLSLHGPTLQELEREAVPDITA